MDVIDGKLIEVDICVQQLSDKNKRAEFSDDKTELLGTTVLKWILNVSP